MRRCLTLIVTLPIVLCCTGTGLAATWSIQETPNPSLAKGSALLGVACPSTTSCTAVGTFQNSSEIWGAMGEEWNGTSWSVAGVEANPGLKNGALHAISCWEGSKCMAVGDYGDSGGHELALAEKQTGATWKTEATVKPGTESALRGVSCGAATKCIATGSALATKWGGLAENWNGTGTWTEEFSLLNPGEKNGNLLSVSCYAELECIAAGRYGNSLGESKTWAEARNEEGTWGLQATEGEPVTYNQFSSISCFSGTSCMAVGYSGTLLTKLIASRYSGGIWTQKKPVVPSGAGSTQLAGVSCKATKTCVAVGSYRNGSGVLVTLAEIWNGTEWKVQETPNPSGAKESELSAVACSAAEECTAVGSYVASTGKLMTLAERLK